MCCVFCKSAREHVCYKVSRLVISTCIIASPPDRNRSNACPKSPGCRRAKLIAEAHPGCGTTAHAIVLVETAAASVSHLAAASLRSLVLGGEAATVAARGDPNLETA